MTIRAIFLSQFDKLFRTPMSETYRLKVSGDSGETKWLTISHDDMLAIRRLLRDTEREQEAAERRAVKN